MVSRRLSRFDRITTVWMVVALACSVFTVVFRGVLPQSWWTLIHVVTIGVLTNAIFQWSWFFARSLLRLPANNRHAHRDLAMRQVLLNVALTLLIAGMWTGTVWLTLVGSTGIAAVVAWHGSSLIVAARSSLGSRYAVIIRYYIAAAGFLVFGCLYGGLITVTMFASDIPEWLVDARSGVTVAHALINGAGWIGLSIAGTLVTLAPTMLRVRMDPTAVSRAIRGLPIIVITLSGAAIAVTFGQGWFAGVLLWSFQAALAWAVGIPLIREAMRKAPASYGTWTMLAGIVWTNCGLFICGGMLVFTADTASFQYVSRTLIVLIGTAGILQIFIAALSYLMPVVIGGGPRSVKVGIAAVNSAGVFRVVIRQCTVVLLAVGGPLQGLWGSLLAITYLADVLVMARAGFLQARMRKEVLR